MEHTHTHTQVSKVPGVLLGNFYALMLGRDFGIFGLRVETFSFFIYLAFWSAGLFFFWDTRKTRMRFWPLCTLFLIVAIFGPIGASALSAFELQRPFRILSTDSGSSHVGGYLLALPIIVLATKLLGLELLEIMDSVTLSWIIGYGVGRLACFFSGDGCYGTPTDSVIGMTFPKGLIPTFTKVWPTPLLETGYSILVFAIFYLVYRREAKPSIPGRIFLGASSWMFLLRFSIEFIRLNPKYYGFTLTQWITIPLILIYSGINFFLVDSTRKSLIPSPFMR